MPRKSDSEFFYAAALPAGVYVPRLTLWGDHHRRLEDFRKKRAKENKDDLHFPDEIDTPRHTPAQTRFARYRGLKSFRTSAWDPYEDLPLDYAKIFQFEDYERTRRRCEEAGREEGVHVGTRVCIRIKGVPRKPVEERDPKVPLIVHGLLQHEHKQSVLHFAVQRNTEYEEPVRAKVSFVHCMVALVPSPTRSLSRRTPSFSVLDREGTGSTLSTLNILEVVARETTMFTRANDTFDMVELWWQRRMDRLCLESRVACCSRNPRT